MNLRQFNDYWSTSVRFCGRNVKSFGSRLRCICCLQPITADDSTDYFSSKTENTCHQRSTTVVSPSTCQTSYLLLHLLVVIYRSGSKPLSDLFVWRFHWRVFERTHSVVRCIFCVFAGDENVHFDGARIVHLKAAKAYFIIPITKYWLWTVFQHKTCPKTL